MPRKGSLSSALVGLHLLVTPAGAETAPNISRVLDNLRLLRDASDRAMLQIIQSTRVEPFMDRADRCEDRFKLSKGKGELAIVLDGKTRYPLFESGVLLRSSQKVDDMIKDLETSPDETTLADAEWVWKDLLRHIKGATQAFVPIDYTKVETLCQRREEALPLTRLPVREILVIGDYHLPPDIHGTAFKTTETAQQPVSETIPPHER